MTNKRDEDLTVRGTAPMQSGTTGAPDPPEPSEVAEPFLLTPGMRVGKYELLERLDSGGMGIVFKARHTALDKRVALKVIATMLQTDLRATSRFMREMQAIGRIAPHPNVLNGYDAGEADSIHYIATELIEGVQLAALVKNIGSLSVSESCRIIAQAASALEHLRKHKLVHRDIKPSNLMLTRDGTVKVVDMGLALLHDEQAEQITTMGETMGSIDYMAPEQWIDSHNVDWRCDVYSLGCTFYYLLAGSAPYSRSPMGSVSRMRAHLESPFPDIRAQRKDVPPGAYELLMGMVHKDPQKRITDLSEISQRLNQIASGDLKELAERGFSIPSNKGQEAVAPGKPRNVLPVAGSFEPEGITKVESNIQQWLMSRVARGAIYAGFAGLIIAGLMALYRRTPEPQPAPNGALGSNIAHRDPPSGIDGSDPDTTNDLFTVEESLDSTPSPTIGSPLLFLGHRSKVMDVVFLDSPLRLASISDDGVLCIFGFDDPTQPLMTTRVSPRAAVALVYVNETDSLVIASEDGTLKWISVSDGSTQRTENLPGVGFSGLARFADREQFVSSDWNGDVRRMTLREGRFTSQIIGNRDEVVYDVDISTDGQWVAWVGRRPDVTLYRMSDQSVRDLVGHQYWVYDVSFSPDGFRLATAGHEGIVKIWSVIDGTLEFELPCIVPQAIRFFPDSRRLAVGGRDARLQIWEVEPLRRIHDVRLGVPIDCIAISSDSSWVAAGGNDGTLMAWSLPVASH